jgi:cation:H+ antiporter
VGIAVVVIGSEWLVDGAVAIARMLGVSDTFIGLTVVAIGTSSPELVTTVVATLRNNRDIAVGNLLGSSVYNVLLILGVTCLVPPSGIHIDPDLIRVDIPVMTAATLVCVPVLWSGRRVTRLEGALFVGAYIAYLTYLVLART